MEFLRTRFLKNSPGLLLVTLQVLKVDRNVSRYWNNDIKVMSIKAILVILCQLWKWFCLLKKNFENQHPEKLIKISEICEENMWQSFVIVKPWPWSLWSYEVLFWNFTWDPDLLSSLPGLLEPNSEVLTIRLLLHVLSGYRKTVYT